MLKYGLGIVLIFVGLKMTVFQWLFEEHFPIAWSLGIIVGVIAVSVILSLLFPRPPEEEGASPIPFPPGHEIVTHHTPDKRSDTKEKRR
jgi:membrane protease YdiL (CAAX protease family)